MGNLKKKHIEIAKKVWELYQNNMKIVEISKEVAINRAEVSHIIKYTTSSLFLTNNDADTLINTLRKENEILSKNLSEWKYSTLDAYQNNNKTGKKLTYKRLVEIYTDDIKRLKTETSDVYEKQKKFKKRYWIFFSIMLFLIFLTGGYIKGYVMATQNYHQIDISTSWESQEGDTLYRLLKKN